MIALTEAASIKTTDAKIETRWHQRTTEKLRRDATEDDLYSHLMYPPVFAEFARYQREFSDVSMLPTPAFFHGLIAAIAVSVGHKVAKGDKLLMMEAMKMQTTVSAPCDGVVAEIAVTLGETVESKDLLVRLRA